MSFGGLAGVAVGNGFLFSGVRGGHDRCGILLDGRKHAGCRGNSWTLLFCPLLAGGLSASVRLACGGGWLRRPHPVLASVLTSQLFDQLSSSDGLLVLQVLGPVTVALSVLGVCAATLDLKLLLLLVRHTHTHTHGGANRSLSPAVFRSGPGGICGAGGRRGAAGSG